MDYLAEWRDSRKERRSRHTYTCTLVCTLEALARSCLFSVYARNVLVSGTRCNGRVGSHCPSLEKSYDGGLELAVSTGRGNSKASCSYRDCYLTPLRQTGQNVKRRCISSWSYLWIVSNEHDRHVSAGLAGVRLSGSMAPACSSLDMERYEPEVRHPMSGVTSSPSWQLRTRNLSSCGSTGTWTR
jgi:hypothetical protein